MNWWSLPIASSTPIRLRTRKSCYHPPAGEQERPLIDRLTLHAEKLRFVDRAGATVELLAPLPKDFRAALNMLRKYARG